MKTSRLALPANPCGTLRPRVPTLANLAGRSCLSSLSLIRKCLFGIFLSALPSAAGIVSWNPNPELGIARYEVSYGTSPGVHTTTVNAGLNTNATLTGLVGGQTYYIVVRAVNEAGLISPPSTEVSYQTPNTSPTNQAPVAGSGSASTNEDTPILVTVSASDPDNNPLTYHIVTGPTKGAVTGAGPAFTYTPNADANGTDTFTYRVNDGTLNSNTATVTITIHPVNDAPVAANRSVSTNEDVAVGITLVGTDKENDPLTYHIVAGPTKGALSGTGASRTYTPNADATGTDTFTYRVNGGTLDSNIATVTITIHPVNDAPVAANSSVSTNENVAVAVTLSGTDKENDPLTYHIVALPAKGVLTGTGADRTYSPNAGANGTDTFTYRVNDGTLDSSIATVTITLLPLDTPVAANKTVSTSEDVAAALILSGTANGNSTLTYHIVAGPAKGVLSGTGANRTYTPNADANGPDSFTYRVNDGTLDSNIATVTITIHPVNDAPVAVNSSVSTHENVALDITLSTADKDLDTLAFQIIDGPLHGTLTGQAPNLVYLPDLDFLGDDSFTFRANDGVDDSLMATVSIHVKKDFAVTDLEPLPTSNWSLKYVDSEELAGYPATSAFDGNPGTFWHTRFTNNPTAPPHEIQIDLGDVCLVRGFHYLPRQDKFLIGNISSYQFYLSLDGNTWGLAVATGVFPNDKVKKEVRFNATRARYVRLVALDEANGAMHSAIAELGVLGSVAGNGAPMALAFSASTDFAKPVTLELMATDPDGDELSYEIVESPAKGTLSGSAPDLVYTPSAGASGTDSFTYRAGDGVSFSNVVTVNLTINPANRRPVAQAVFRSTVEAAPVSLTLSGSDEDADSILFRISKNPANGKLTGTPPNLIYTPAAGFSGTDSFLYVANDGKADSAPAPINIQVARRNRPPVSGSKSYSTDSGSPVSIVLSATDPDGDSLTYVIVTAPGNGTLSGNLPSVTYQPAAGFEGVDSFRFTASDGKGISQAAAISIVVRGEKPTEANQAPAFKFSPVTRAAGMENTLYKANSLADAAIDPDKDDSLVFSKISGPKWLNIADNGDLSGTPPANSAGTNRFEIAVTDGNGGKAETLLLIDVVPAGLPLPWEVDYIGMSGKDGEAAHKRGTFSLSQAGKPNGGEDAVSFLWQTMSGDGQIIARVAGVKNGQAATRAGVMIRDSLAPKSRHVFLGVNGKSEVRSVTRNPGGDNSTTNTHGGENTPRIWVKMVRKGDVVRSYKSHNGKKWLLASTRKIDLNKNCYIGLAVSGGAGKATTGLFRNVKVRP